MTETFMHNDFESTYDEPDHAIPALGYIDNWGVRKDGGADFHIIVAKPLQSDEHSQKRLLEKMKGYLGFIRSKDFAAECPLAAKENTTIIVDIHPSSSAEAFDLLERCKPWVDENNANLRIEKLELKEK